MKFVSFTNLLFLIITIFVVVFIVKLASTSQQISIESPLKIPQQIEKQFQFVHPRLRGLDDWVRPEGPWHVALQVGHLDSRDAPDELERIRENTGAQYGSITEVSVSQQIAELTKQNLEVHGIKVTLLPTTIPPNFWSDVFVSIHADGNSDTQTSGYKIAASARDYTGKAPQLVSTLEKSYEAATGLRQDPNITRNMRGYYGFNWRRYDHSAHPMAVAAIVETGFITSPTDRTIIVEQPEKSARGLSDGIIAFLQAEAL